MRLVCRIPDYKRSRTLRVAREHGARVRRPVTDRIVGLWEVALESTDDVRLVRGHGDGSVLRVRTPAPSLDSGVCRVVSAGIGLRVLAGRLALRCRGTCVVRHRGREMAQVAELRGCGSCGLGLAYFFVALPSMNVIHVVPSMEISNLMLWLVGETILIVIFCLISWPP